MKKLLALALLAVTSLAFGQATVMTTQANAPTTGTVPTVICRSGAAVSAPLDATEDTLATCTLAANALGPNGMVRITHQWSFTNSVNNKTLRVRYSGGAGTMYWTPVLTTQVAASAITTFMNRSATNSQIGDTQFAITDGGPSVVSSGKITSAVDTTASTTILLTCQKATAAEACTLERYLVELIQ